MPSTPQFNNNKSYTDIVFQEFALFIEGVEVPFASISISSGLGVLPSAVITVPPAPALMDIAVFYQPKVHVFYRDTIGDVDDGTTKAHPEIQPGTWRLLFKGIIASSSYQKSINSAAENIQFSCVHKYSVVQDMLLDYTARYSLQTERSTQGTSPSAANSQVSILTALASIEPNDPAREVLPENSVNVSSPSVLPSFLINFKNRVLGIPGIMINFWQQIKRDCFNKDLAPYMDIFNKLYLPLVESGLQIFQRTVGHRFIENLIDGSKTDYDCGAANGGVIKVVTPHPYRLFIESAVQQEMVIRVMHEYLQSSGEITDIYTLFNSVFDSIDYDMITLASPAESGNMLDGKSTWAADTIVKPKLPFYYSPSCNIFLPNMYLSLNVNNDEINIPSRLDFRNDDSIAGDNSSALNNYFRAPAAVREAIAGTDKDLIDSTGLNRGKFSKYEQGRGVKLERGVLPRWLSMFSAAQFSDQNSKENWPDPSQKNNYDALNALAAAWTARYGVAKDRLNPWLKNPSLQPSHRMLFSAVDYYYTQFVARSKAGVMDCPFNPYVVPGYPLDIISGSPTAPSFHGLCTSITHTITSNSCQTTVSFAAAMTYSQLVNYYVPFVHPWLQVSLGLVNNPTLVDNPEGKVKAIEFYKDVLSSSVTALGPEDLFDFNTGLPKPLMRGGSNIVGPGGSATSIKGSNGGEINPNLSYQGNLSLAYREIESKQDIMKREDIKFIDMTPVNYNSTVFKYTDKVIKDPSQRLDLNQSPFLDYADLK